MSGIRDAHEAKLIPQRKNRVLVAARAIRPLFVCVMRFSKVNFLDNFNRSYVEQLC